MRRYSGSTTANHVYIVHVLDPDPQIFRVYDASGSTHSDATCTACISTNSWQHIALTWDGTTVIFYVNGAVRMNGEWGMGNGVRV